MEVAMAFDPEEKLVKKGRIEKHVLRQAFEGYLPEEILWRQKEQFSDGVGYGWIDALKAHAEKEVTDEMMESARHRFLANPPQSKEEYLYRTIFEEHYPNPMAASLVPTGPSIACSTPTAYRWSKEFEEMADPSGRAVKGIHEKYIDF